MFRISIFEFIKHMVNFLKFRWLYFVISAIVILSGLFSIIRWGYIYSIDFVGGSNLQYQFSKQISRSGAEEVLKSKNILIENLEISGKNTLLLRTRALEENKETDLRNALAKKFGAKATVLQSQTVGPTLGRETIEKTIIAAIIGILGIIIYMSFSFKGINYAIAAIAAAFHDMLVIFGSYSILSHFFGAQLDTMFVTAVLTSLSLSVHDTIVVFDKIREYKKSSSGNVEYFANRALTETMVRSVNNTMTIVFTLLALVLLGGSTIRFLATALLIGTLTGTYSSPFVATPIFVWLEKRK